MKPPAETWTAPNHPCDRPALSAAVKREAHRLGFELVGIAPAVTPAGIHEFLDWIKQGYAGGMDYIPRREAAYEHPRHVLDGAKSLVMLGLNYNTTDSGRSSAGVAEQPGCSNLPPARGPHPSPLPEGEGDLVIPARVARYAQGGADYHDVIRGKLHQLCELVRREAPGCKVRGVVDTAPLPERDFARLAGLGWIGKNTMLINKRIGSWFFLAALLVDIELEYDEPHGTSHCGTCTRCLEACPTDAFPAPYVLDARRCIAYLTIEHKGPIPEEFHAGIGEWLFGCDICQEVCPWNRKAPITSEPAFLPRADLNPADAADVLSLTEEDFQERFGQTALARPGREGLRRNAAIVVENRRVDRSLHYVTR